ncbi:MAG: carboxypeptidase regulatory-like domain-containing protein [Chitinophagaceae bacterium]|nr:carboxypeptidase regulatory-like domain-containing protein [Chitinophagaceae bacterium]
MKNLAKSIFAILCIILTCTTHAQISGTVFRDYNGNGTRQSGAGYTEPGAGGVIIRAYNSSDLLIATQTTSSATATLGQYNFPALGLNSVASATAVRLEFIIPASGACAVNSTFDFSSASGAVHGTSVRFVTAGAAAININYAINDPNDYLGDAAPFTNTMLFVPRYHSGNATGSGTSAAGGVFYKMSYASKGQTALPVANKLALNSQIGTCYGVAYSKQSNKVFTSAFLKRHNGFGPANGTFNNAPGAIYIIDPTLTSSTGAASYFTSLDALGSPTHNSTGSPAYGAGTSYNITGTGYGATISYTATGAGGLGVIGTNLNRGLPNDSTVRSTDPAAFGQVGKVSLGDIEISDDGQFLFITNFYDRKLYQLQLNSVSNPTSATLVNSWSLPNPPLRSTSGLTNAATTYTGANNGTNFYDGARGLQRPFALKYYRGKVYVGAVTTGEGTGAVSTQEINNNGVPEYTDLWAYVWEFNPGTGTFTATPTLQTPLNFNRGTNVDGQNETWKPWTNTVPAAWSTASTPDYAQYQQPMFCDIEFDADATMILGFRDRFGDQSAYDQSGINGSISFAGQAMGDMYRAYYNVSTCTYEFEQNGKEGPGSTKAATAGAGSGQGPSNYTTANGEFYYRDHVYDGNTATNIGTFHLNALTGALAIIKGSDSVVVTAMDPLRAWSSGLSWFGSTGGDNGRDYEMFAGAGAGTFPVPVTGAIGKANGLGDIELLSTAAPLEVGNSIWNDANGNGIQDAGEAAMANVTLEIFADFNNDGVPDGAALGTTTTSGSGQWYFNNSNITDGDPGTAGNQPGLKYGAGYIVRVAAADWNGATGTGIGDLAGFQLTKKDKIGNGQVDLSDSDADLSSGAAISPQIQFIAGAAGQNNHNYDFGFKALASIGDKAWRDDDKDGIQDAGEPGLAGITVTLYDNLGNVAGTTVTDAYGFYLFDNLAAGTYQVGFTAPANYNFTTQTNNTDNSVLTGGSTAANGSDANATTGRTANIVLSAGENERNIDAGFIFSQPPNNSIGDRVWLDSDGNGNQNGTEPGISGVTVTLYAADGITIVATTVTDANGNYLFTGLPAATDYIVGLTLPAGLTYTSSGGTTAGNATINSDVSATTGKTTLINTGAAGNQITGIDAGLILTNNATASLGDKVWIDLPGGTANVQDAGEPGLAGVTVNLYKDANADGIINGAEASTPYATTVTDAFGNYIFNNLPGLVYPGMAYQVRFVLPVGYTFVTANVGTDDFKNSDADATGLTKIYRISPGQRNLSVDAGVTQNSPAGTARLGDKVWFDANADGIQDAGEPGVAGVTVTLYNSGGTAIGTTTTDANGYYQFINLAAGTYSVGFSNLPAGYSFTASTGTTSADATTNSDANPGTGRTTNFTILAAQSLQGLDCGLTAGLASGLGSIGNKVWYDLPGGSSGVQETGELGVSGVTVTLLDAGSDGIVGNGDDGASRTTNTNALGEYIFTGLPAGNYAVQFSNLPGSYTVTTANAGIDDILDSDGGAVGTGGAPAGASRTVVYNLAAGEDNLTVDLGLVPPANTNTLGNYVWFDKNNDGIQDANEQGLAGVMVTLYNNAGTAIAITTTNVNGEYLFTGLADGNYSTGFTNLPAGFNFTTASLTNTANGSDADRTSGRTATVTLNAGNRNDRTLDAGLISSRAALGNFVWMDSNGDGIQTALEPAVPGVTVSLFRPGFGLDGIAGNGDDALAVASMITDQNGQYLFENLLPGTYQVAFTTIPTGIIFTQQDAGGNDNLDSDVNPATGLTANVVLAAGDINLTVDAGLFKPRAVIGNYVWADKNDNGIQDAGEPGFAGVVVTLFNGGIPVATAVTDANGGYLFPNVAPGNYTMTFTNLPTGVSFTIPDAGGNDNLDSDVLGVSITGITVTTTTVNLSFDGGLNNASTLASKIEFTAFRKNTTAELNWKITTAINEVKEFVVERSANGSSYTSIATVSSANVSTYKQIDLQPNAGVNYYRIKIIYLGGVVKYSDVRVLNFNSKAAISVFPNPATDVINIQLPDSWQGKALSIDLINQAGQVVNSKSTKQASQVERLTVNQLAAGVYILRIQDGNGNVETNKIRVH